MDNPVARLPYKELEPWHYYCDNIVALLKARFPIQLDIVSMGYSHVGDIVMLVTYSW